MMVMGGSGIIPAALLSTTMLMSTPAASQDLGTSIENLKREVSKIEVNIASLKKPDSSIGLLMQSRLETTKLTLALLQNQKLASEGAGVIEIVVPAVQPDNQRAEEVLKSILVQQNTIKEAEQEAANASGLVQAVATTGVQAEKLLLSQLNAAWYQAKYGISLPVFKQPDQNPGVPTTTDVQPALNSDEPALEYADSNFPDIDYSQAIFGALDKEGYEISGWWGFTKYRAKVDDSPAVYGINVSAFTEGYGDDPSLRIRCHEGEASVIFEADDYLLTDFQTHTIPVTYRIDRAKAKTSSWNTLTSNKGVGLFGVEAEAFLRKLYGSKEAFFRLSESNGEMHAMSIDMSGADKIIDAAAAACGFSTLDLSHKDYKVIQTMLNAGGYNAGAPDGQWGHGSKAAMRAFQAANNLPETGAPDRHTLRTMGLDF